MGRVRKKHILVACKNCHKDFMLPCSNVWKLQTCPYCGSPALEALEDAHYK